MIKGVKDTFVDVKANLDDGTKVIIEMQILNHKGFEKRVLYNAAKNYSILLNKAEDYHLLNPVIALSIVDFVIFVELPKFNKDIDSLQNIKEQWIYFLKNVGSLEYIPSNQDETIKKALQNANEANLSKEELEAQHKRKEFIFIHKLAILKASEDGFEKCMERGMEEKNIEIAINSIKQGLDNKTISLITGLSIGIVKNLRK